MGPKCPVLGSRKKFTAIYYNIFRLQSYVSVENAWPALYSKTACWWENYAITVLVRCIRKNVRFDVLHPSWNGWRYSRIFCPGESIVVLQQPDRRANTWLEQCWSYHNSSCSNVYNMDSWKILVSRRTAQSVPSWQLMQYSTYYYFYIENANLKADMLMYFFAYMQRILTKMRNTGIFCYWWSQYASIKRQPQTHFCSMVNIRQVFDLISWLSQQTTSLLLLFLIRTITYSEFGYFLFKMLPILSCIFVIVYPLFQVLWNKHKEGLFTFYVNNRGWRVWKC